MRKKRFKRWACILLIWPLILMFENRITAWADLANGLYFFDEQVGNYCTEVCLDLHVQESISLLIHRKYSEGLLSNNPDFVSVSMEPETADLNCIIDATNTVLSISAGEDAEEQKVVLRVVACYGDVELEGVIHVTLTNSVHEESEIESETETFSEDEIESESVSQGESDMEGDHQDDDDPEDNSEETEKPGRGESEAIESDDIGIEDIETEDTESDNKDVIEAESETDTRESIQESKHKENRLNKIVIKETENEDFEINTDAKESVVKPSEREGRQYYRKIITKKPASHTKDTDTMDKEVWQKYKSTSLDVILLVFGSIVVGIVYQLIRYWKES